MGLVLGVTVGEKVYIGEDWIRVVRRTGETDLVLENADQSAYTVREELDDGIRGEEAIPGVFVKAGYVRGAHGRQARLHIEAPQDLRILREDAYESLALHRECHDILSILRTGCDAPVGEGDDFLREVDDILDDLDEQINRIENPLRGK